MKELSEVSDETIASFTNMTKISNKWTSLLSPAFDVVDYLSPRIQITCHGTIVSADMKLTSD